MADLERQLRELSSDKFESLVHQYLVAKFPVAGIKRVEGAGGDGGLDSFAGLLGLKPAVWQCKHFPNRIGKDQKRQVLHSIQRAFETSTPSLWTLCVPINLRTAEHRWFQEEIVKLYGGPDRIKLLQGSDFFAELLHNRALRDAFFPENAISEIRSIREAIAAGDNRTPQTIEKLLIEFAQQYLEGKMDLEPRLVATVEIGGGPDRRLPANRPGLVFSVGDAHRTVNLFAKDLSTYNSDPIEITTTFAPENSAEFREAIDSGQPFRVPAGGIVGLTSSSPLINSFIANTDFSKAALELRPQVPASISSRIVPLRFVAGFGDSAKELFYVPFKTVRVGLREVTLSSNSLLPITITVILRLPQEAGATVSLRPILAGADLQQLHLVLEFLEELESSGNLEIFSLETNERFLKQEQGSFKSSLDIPRWVRKLIANAALVSQHLRIPITFPGSVTWEDATDLEKLVQIVTNRELSDVVVCGTFVFSEERRKSVAQCLDQPGFQVRVDLARGSKSFRVFGRSIDIGSMSFFAERCSFQAAEKVRSFCAEAKEGDTFPVSIQCEGPCRWKWSPEEWNPQDAFRSH